MPTGTHSTLSMLTDFFSSDDIEAAARRTGFVKRASKLTGKLFLALITFGAWSDATTTLAQLAAKVTHLEAPGGAGGKGRLNFLDSSSGGRKTAITGDTMGKPGVI